MITRNLIVIITKAIKIIDGIIYIIIHRPYDWKSVLQALLDSKYTLSGRVNDCKLNS